MPKVMLCQRPVPRLRGLRRQSRGLPENATYRDTGCEVASSCLRCPLPMCKYDDPTWGRRNDLAARDDEIVKLHEVGISVQKIALQLGVSTRTVYRVVQRRSLDPPRNRGVDTTVPLMSLDELARWNPSRVYGEYEEDPGLTARSRH